MSNELHQGFLATPDALQFAGLTKSAFNNATSRGLYPAAPKARQGQARQFGVNDLVAAYVLGFLLECNVLQSFACEIACDVLVAINKRPNTETLAAWKCTKANGSPYVVVQETEPRTRSIRLFEFPISEIRSMAVNAIDAKRSVTTS